MIDFKTFTKLPKKVGDLGKLIVAKGFKKLPKVQKIAQSGHTDCVLSNLAYFPFTQSILVAHWKVRRWSIDTTSELDKNVITRQSTTKMTFQKLEFNIFPTKW